jgi:dihydrofolate synthase/folylpolyglutamate synthase
LARSLLDSGTEPYVKGSFACSDEVYERLLRYVNVEKGQKTVFKLDRMLELCSLLGNPERAYRTIHVAGSKGKGSVSTMIARVLEAGGRRAGLYTSPHLLRWKERMSLAGDEMPEDCILASAREVLGLVDGKEPSDFPGDELPTYFELTTLIAFCAFRRADCEDAIIETGLGGRLDSTNVVLPAASVITPIELEHTEWLGDTIPKIAYEKSGIIKAGKPCFVSRQRPEAREVIAARARELHSPLREAPGLAEASGLSVVPSGTFARISFGEDSPLRARYPLGIEARTPMIGRIHGDNMALSLLVAGEIEPNLDLSLAVRGLSSAFLPARFELLRHDPPLVLDGAHTPDSIRLCVDTFETLFPGPASLLFGCAEDKRSEEMASMLAGKFEFITLTRPGLFKKGNLASLERSFAGAGASYRSIEDHVEAIAFAVDEARRLSLPLLVAGSFYLCAEVAKSAPR